MLYYFDCFKDKQHRERALAMFMKALRVQPKNIWAANGVGMILVN